MEFLSLQHRDVAKFESSIAHQNLPLSYSWCVHVSEEHGETVRFRTEAPNLPAKY